MEKYWLANFDNAKPFSLMILALQEMRVLGCSPYPFNLIFVCTFSLILIGFNSELNAPMGVDRKFNDEKAQFDNIQFS